MTAGTAAEVEHVSSLEADEAQDQIDLFAGRVESRLREQHGVEPLPERLVLEPFRHRRLPDAPDEDHAEEQGRDSGDTHGVDVVLWDPERTDVVKRDRADQLPRDHGAYVEPDPQPWTEVSRADEQWDRGQPRQREI